MQTIKITTSQNIDIDYTLAGIGERALARLIDYTIFLALYFASFIVTGMFTRGALNSATLAIGVAIWLVLCVFYDLITEIFFNGQSVGKRAMKIKVISLNGRRPSVGQYLLRWVFRLIDFGLSGGSLALIFIIMTDNGQRLGDLVAGTVVVWITPSTQFHELIFKPSDTENGYLVRYPQVRQLVDDDIVLIHDVIRNFNRTRNNTLIYDLAVRVKKFLNITDTSDVNEYQFLELVLADYNHVTSTPGA